nr:hypothetical protein Iba_chr13fCG5280 [Ipomoea batatas]
MFGVLQSGADLSPFLANSVDLGLRRKGRFGVLQFGIDQPFQDLRTKGKFGVLQSRVGQLSFLAKPFQAREEKFGVSQSRAGQSPFLANSVDLALSMSKGWFGVLMSRADHSPFLAKYVDLGLFRP